MLEVIRDRIDQQRVDRAVVQAVDPSLAEEILAKTKQIFTIRDVTVMDLLMPAVAHLGFETIGNVAYPVSDEEPGE